VSDDATGHAPSVAPPGAGTLRSRALDATLLDHVQVAVIVTDLEGRIVDCNRYAAELFGTRLEQLVGAPSGELSLVPLDRDLVREIAERLVDGKTWEGDFRVRRRDGSDVFLRAVESGVFDDAGRLCAVVSIAADVTQPRRASRRLVAQQELTRALAAAADLEDASRRILEIARERLEWSFGALWEVDGDALRCVEVSAADDVDPSFAAETLAARLRRGEGLPGRVWVSGEALELVDVSDDPGFPRSARARAAGLGRAIAVPVTGTEDVLGVLELFSVGTAPTDADLVGALGAFGIQLGQFLERRRAQESVRVSEARKTAMLEAALDPVVSIDDHGCVVEWNGAAERTFGWRRDEAVGRPMHELIVPPARREAHRDGLRRHLEDGRRTLLDRRVETTARRRDGIEIPIELAVTRTEDLGRPMFTAFLRDMSARVRAEAERDELVQREHAARTRLELLTRLGDILTVDLDAAARLQAIASVLLPVFADVCAVITREAEGPIRFAALAHADPEKQALIDSVLQWRAFPVEGNVSPGVVITGEPVIIEEVAAGMFDAAFPDQHERAVISELDLRSVLVVPLVGGDGPIGALGFGSSDPDRRYGADDLALAEEIARRFAPAVEGAFRLDQERAVAETLQRSLLPEHLPAISELELAARYLPSAAGVSVGGDWYDVLSLPDGRVLLAIGDVVGHGVPAAAVMGRARAALQFCALAEIAPGELLTRLNTFFAAAEPGATMLTVFVAIYDPATGRITYANAGHPPPTVRLEDGGVRFLDEVRGAPLGADANHSYVECGESLPTGATVVLYTDGLVERRRESLDAGFARLLDALADAPVGVDDLLDHLVERLLSDTVPVDDVALVAFRPVGDAAHLQLTLPAQPRQLRVLRTRLAGWLARHGVAPDVVFDVNLAVNEAAANAVAHAYGLEDGVFDLDARFEDDTLVCTVRDRGRWRERPRDGDGRGLLLMHALTDGVDIEVGVDGTRVVLRREVSRGGAPTRTPVA
jgi:PAS domain S-box-containing protein